MMEAMHSTPRYQTVETLHWNAPKYVMVLQHAASAVTQQLTKMSKQHPQTVQLMLDSQQDQALAGLLHELETVLQQEKAGVRAVVCGDESFVWTVQQCLVGTGCLDEEISLIADSSSLQNPRKKVYCVHCGHIQHTVKDELCSCEQCQVELLIRSHFSERLGAYMGVCANAHQPMGVLSA
ncbi:MULTISPECIES: dimethylamine monooxygenase subunit DmmA family protein [Acinetobacter]|uniref:dimethylamine monooxygenase subunit DmmA family protein n=1 Tax=Acinetobacter TaxID=469 RepID=UPI000E6A9884|nr:MULTISPECIES: dimethylamine monooxygenase subunit DmmA family protein [Acinetobacter]NNP67572.1 hypothetical protein [Acinetobacter sp. Ac_5812]